MVTVAGLLLPAGAWACGCSRGEGARSRLRHHRICTVRCRLRPSCNRAGTTSNGAGATPAGRLRGVGAPRRAADARAGAGLPRGPGRADGDRPTAGRAHGLHRRRRRDLDGLRGRLRRPPLPGAGSMALRPVPPARPARACRPVPSAAAGPAAAANRPPRGRGRRRPEPRPTVPARHRRRLRHHGGGGGVQARRRRDVRRGASSGNIKTFPDALWWAITIVTTVGYGDRYPTTGTGRLVGGALMLVGIALLGV